MSPARREGRRDPSSGWGFVALAAFAGISPLATDIYTPALPQVGTEYGAGSSAVQLTLTGFMLGLAVGQLVVGSLSDAWGRRRLLLAGGMVSVLAAVACALAPTLGVFVAARVVQGFAGAAGVVLARAIIADSTEGARTGRLIGVMMSIVGVAPVIAPLIGAVIIQASGWRTVFWAIAAILAAVTALAAWRVPETLPPASRRSARPRDIAAALGVLLRRCAYLGYLLTFCLAFGTFLSYISASSFILQVQHGMGPLAYGLVFAGCAAVMTASSMTAAQLSGRVPYLRMLRLGVSGLLLSAALLAVAGFTGTPLWLFLTGCVLLTASMGQIMPNATTLALNQARDLAGTASAALGTAQFLAGAAVAPLVGLAGEHDARPFGVSVALCAALAGCAFFLVALPAARRAGGSD